MRMPTELLFLAGSFGLLGYGLFLERHEVRSLADDSVQTLSGPAYVEGATVDSYMRQNGRLYDTYSLSPLEASQKDCKT